jgi:tRNA threonylcarbamoyladenosine biosynthesis protein TsaB
MFFIEASLKEAGLTYKDLSAIAVSQDQGLIRLRIGVSAAKGLCFALELPLIAVDTLKVLASQASISSGLIVPMIDARNGSIQRYFAADFERVRDVRAEIINEILSKRNTLFCWTALS